MMGVAGCFRDRQNPLELFLRQASRLFLSFLSRFESSRSSCVLLITSRSSRRSPRSKTGRSLRRSCSTTENCATLSSTSSSTLRINRISLSRPSSSFLRISSRADRTLFRTFSERQPLHQSDLPSQRRLPRISLEQQSSDPPSLPSKSDERESFSLALPIVLSSSPSTQSLTLPFRLLLPSSVPSTARGTSQHEFPPQDLRDLRRQDAEDGFQLCSNARTEASHDGQQGFRWCCCEFHSLCKLKDSRGKKGELNLTFPPSSLFTGTARVDRLPLCSRQQPHSKLRTSRQDPR